MAVACGLPAGSALAGPPADPPGLELLRTGQAGRMQRALGLSSLSELPTYRLDLSISDTASSYEGRGTVTWTNTTGGPVAALPFALHPNAAGEGGGTLEVSAMTVTDGPAGTWSLDAPTAGTLALDRPLAAGESIVVEMAFGGALRPLPPGSNDVFASLGQAPEGGDYGLLGQGDGLVTAATAYPMLAPWRDGAAVVTAPAEVGDLAWNAVGAFEVRVVTPEGLRVVTNLVDTDPEPLSGGAWVTRAAGAGVRDLVVVASRDFATAERTVGDVTVRSWFLSRDRAGGEAALDDAAASLETIADLVGSYPFTELDVVEATLAGGAGGVEFSALVLIAGTLYRDPLESTSPLAVQLRTLSALSGRDPGEAFGDTFGDVRRFTVAHEVAHQWSPGLVGADAHRDPIVDEPLAQYLAGRVVRHLDGDAAGRDIADRNVKLNYALYRMLGGPDAAADRPVAAYSGTLEYAALVYGKAPYLYLDLEDDVGTARLDSALRTAIAGHAWRVADRTSWVAALEDAGATGARAAARRWWDEAHGDGDLGVDPDGRVALRLLFGDEMAAQVEESFALIGMKPADLFRMLGLHVPSTAGGAAGPSPHEMLEMLE